MSAPFCVLIRKILLIYARSPVHVEINCMATGLDQEVQQGCLMLHRARHLFIRQSPSRPAPTSPRQCAPRRSATSAAAAPARPKPRPAPTLKLDLRLHLFANYHPSRKAAHVGRVPGRLGTVGRSLYVDRMVARRRRSLLLAFADKQTDL